MLDCCVQGTICFEWMKGVPAAIVAVFAAVIAGLIAWRQYRVAQAKLKLDLFEKRLAIFQQTWEILSEVVTKSTLIKNWGFGTPFNDYLPQTLFLFGQEMHAYIGMCAHRWTELNALESQAGRPDLHAKNAFKIAEMRDWFRHEASNLKTKFAPYLDFQHWK